MQKKNKNKNNDRQLQQRLFLSMELYATVVNSNECQYKLNNKSEEKKENEKKASFVEVKERYKVLTTRIFGNT